MRKLRPDAFIYEKRVKFQVEFPGNQIQFPGSHTPLDRIFYTYALLKVDNDTIFYENKCLFLKIHLYE